MNALIKLFLCVLFYNVYAAPVRKTDEKPPEKDVFGDLHYKTYLEEIIKELEQDKTFSDKIKNAQEHNRTEHIAQSLQFVHHKIRSKLDEIKRREINRLNILEGELERRKLQSQGLRVPPPHTEFANIISTDKLHLDHNNVHTFEISDLQKLITKAEEDLLKVDKAQDENYKEHEMKKEYLKKKKLESIKDEDERKKLEASYNASQIRHSNHSKVHHPGSEEQLKEVWEKTDHLDPMEFNPKAFFDLHDLNADGHLDINEVESLMQIELNKVYEANNSDDDMQQKYHEMMRMRQEMMTTIDGNKDGMVSKAEFLKYASTTDFKDNSDWKTQEEENKKPYTDKELKDYEDEYGRNEDDDDDFSDQDESLRYIPKPLDPHEFKLNPEVHTPPIHPNEIADNQKEQAPPMKVESKTDNKNGASSNL